MRFLSTRCGWWILRPRPRPSANALTSASVTRTVQMLLRERQSSVACTWHGQANTQCGSQFARTLGEHSVSCTLGWHSVSLTGDALSFFDRQHGHHLWNSASLVPVGKAWPAREAFNSLASSARSGSRPRKCPSALSPSTVLIMLCKVWASLRFRLAGNSCSCTFLGRKLL